MFKVNNGDTRTRSEIYSKLAIKTPERRQWRRSESLIARCEKCSKLTIKTPDGVNSTVTFEQVNM